MKKIITAITTSLLTLYIKGESALAASDPFSKATDKTNEITEFLSGHFAGAACTLVIVIAGLLWFAGKLKTEWALRIAGGAILIASASEISSFLFQ